MPNLLRPPAHDVSSAVRRLRVPVVVAATTFGLFIGGVPAASAVASADVATVAQVQCGDNVSIYQSPPPIVQTLQRLTYVNCTGRTLHRRADIAWAGDGECKRIGPWETVSLARDVLKKFPIHIRGSKAC